MRKQAFTGFLRILIEYIHFFFRISLCQDSYIYALFFVTAAKHVSMWGDMCCSAFVNQNIFRADNMLKTGHHFLAGSK